MNEPIPSLAEAMAEIRRLRARIAMIEAAEIEVAWLPLCIRCVRLRARIEAMEAEVAIAQGTLAKPAEDEPPFHMKHNVPPSAPPHNERPPIGDENE